MVLPTPLNEPPVTDHDTALFVLPVTVAVNTRCSFGMSVTVEGVTTTFTVLVTVTCVIALRVTSSTLLAAIEYEPSADGAVYTFPASEPPVALSDTPVPLVLGLSVTLSPGASTTARGWRSTQMGGPEVTFASALAEEPG